MENSSIHTYLCIYKQLNLQIDIYLNLHITNNIAYGLCRWDWFGVRLIIYLVHQLVEIVWHIFCWYCWVLAITWICSRDKRQTTNENRKSEIRNLKPKREVLLSHQIARLAENIFDRNANKHPQTGNHSSLLNAWISALHEGMNHCERQRKSNNTNLDNVRLV